MSDKLKKQQPQPQGNPVFKPSPAWRIVGKRSPATQNAPPWLIAPSKVIASCFIFLTVVFSAHALGAMARGVLISGLTSKQASK
jgi:hypothetical protein